MKQYNVKITGKALADMEAIYDYIAKELLNPDAALRALYSASDINARLREGR